MACTSVYCSDPSCHRFLHLLVHLGRSQMPIGTSMYQPPVKNFKQIFDENTENGHPHDWHFSKLILQDAYCFIKKKIEKTTQGLKFIGQVKSHYTILFISAHSIMSLYSLIKFSRNYCEDNLLTYWKPLLSLLISIFVTAIVVLTVHESLQLYMTFLLPLLFVIAFSPLNGCFIFVYFYM